MRLFQDNISSGIELFFIIGENLYSIYYNGLAKFSDEQNLSEYTGIKDL